MTTNIRKLVVQVDETRIEMGQSIDPPTRRAVAMAVIENPYAGRYSESLDELIAIGEELGALLGQKAVAALGIAVVATDGGQVREMLQSARHIVDTYLQAQVLDWQETLQ